MSGQYLLFKYELSVRVECHSNVCLAVKCQFLAHEVSLIHYKVSEGECHLSLYIHDIIDKVLLCLQELIDAITEQVFKLMKSILFEDDWLMFALLVTIQRMNSNHQFTPAELHVFINLRSAVSSKDKSNWIDYEVNAVTFIS